jgi:hypothetical protein
LSGAELIDYAIICRSEMLVSHRSVGPPRGESAYSALGAEIAYDRALLKLCAVYGIESSPQGFSRPSYERNRLERELAARGMDLSKLTRNRKAP